MADEVRLIDADALKVILNKVEEESERDWFKGNEFREMIDITPTIEAEPVKHGRWILSDDKNWLTCSFCGADVDVSCGAPFFYVDNEEVNHINFCPNCGCKQDLEDSDING